jgi:hypothetical protein
VAWRTSVEIAVGVSWLTRVENVIRIIALIATEFVCRYARTWRYIPSSSNLHACEFLRQKLRFKILKF